MTDVGRIDPAHDKPPAIYGFKIEVALPDDAVGETGLTEIADHLRTDFVTSAAYRRPEGCLDPCRRCAA